MKMIFWILLSIPLSIILYRIRFTVISLQERAVLDSALTLFPILMGLNAHRYAFSEICNQYFRLIMYGISVALFLFHLTAYLAHLGIIPIWHFPFYNLSPTSLTMYRVTRFATHTLLIINIGYYVRDAWRRDHGIPL